MTEFVREVPTDLEDAARIHGAGEMQLLWSAILPICRPALGVTGVSGLTTI
jgi:multiple sugar transport system permease protein